MKYVYGIFGIAIAVSALVVGVLGMPEVMFISAGLAIVLLLAANSDRIVRLKAGTSGIEAETRAIIDEARATIEQLRLVAKIAVQANLSLVMRAGRWGGFSYGEKDNVRRESIVALDKLGVQDDEREKIFQEWHTVTRFDYSHILLGRHALPKQIEDHPGLQKEWKELRHGGFANIPSPDTIDRFLRKAGMLDEETKQLLEDYRYYETHKCHRRPEIWKSLVDQGR